MLCAYFPAFAASDVGAAYDCKVHSVEYVLQFSPSADIHVASVTNVDSSDVVMAINRQGYSDISEKFMTSNKIATVIDRYDKATVYRI